MLLVITFNWGTIAEILAVLILISNFFEKFLGITIIGKKIYKGAPSFWKWIMKGATFRKQVGDDITKILLVQESIQRELSYNGGSSTKDQIRSIAQAMKSLADRVRFNEIRLDVADIQNNRMTAILNKDGECRAVNDVFLTTFNYAEEDILGSSFESLIDEKDLNRMQTKWSRAVATKSRFYEQLTMFKKDGGPVEVCMRGFPDIDDKGELHNEYYVTFELK